jgi:hypothetical protein
MPNYELKTAEYTCSIYTPRPAPPIVLPPFFHADFSRDQIFSLLGATPTTTVAGLCFVAGYLSQIVSRERLYAFRVEFDSSGSNLVKSSVLNLDSVVKAKVSDFSDDTNVYSVVQEGANYWEELELYPFIPDHPLQFVFVEDFTLRQLLANTQVDKIRVRKTMINTKQRSLSGIVSEEKFTNYILESLPSFTDKAEAVGASGINNMTDSDVIAYAYGFPCPPRWIPDTTARGGCCICPPNSSILLASGKIMTMGVISRALWANKRAQKLLREWQLIKRPVKLTIVENRITNINIQ